MLQQLQLFFGNSDLITVQNYQLQAF